ncbi:uncharacterized protein LOC141630739 [Silene latifolia]|uniref:uncharacterized protein LOC141630739 n=1 Tax=Silene latifolia TaxID=37657 RepID=UPI003D7876C4
MEILSRALRAMCNDNQVSYHPKCAKLKLTHLIFADDLMVFTRGDRPSIKKATDILKLFSSWSGLQANFDKTEVYFGGVNASLKQQILSDIGLAEGHFPFRYLGLPLNPARLTSSMYEGLVMRIQNLVQSCASKFLSYAGKLQVLNSVVFGLCNFWCGSLLLPKAVCIAITIYCRQLFWGYSEGTRRVIFKSWQSICFPWVEEGFQLKAIMAWNQANMLKWLWHLDRGSGSVWSSWVSKYYLAQCSFWAFTVQEYYSESIRGVILTKDMIIQRLGGMQAAKSALHGCLDHGKFSVGKAYDLIRPRLPTQICYRAVQCCLLLPRYKVILQLAVQRKLATTDMLIQRGVHLVSRCPLCKCKTESTRHLFFKCAYSYQVLSLVLERVQMSIPTADLHSLLVWAHRRKPRKYWKNRWIGCSIATAVYCLWKERNARVFAGQERSMELLVREIHDLVGMILLHRARVDEDTMLSGLISH